MRLKSDFYFFHFDDLQRKSDFQKNYFGVENTILKILGLLFELFHSWNSGWKRRGGISFTEAIEMSFRVFPVETVGNRRDRTSKTRFRAKKKKKNLIWKQVSEASF